MFSHIRNGFVALAALLAIGAGGETYTIHENVHIGQKIPVVWESTTHEKHTVKVNGQQTESVDTQTTQHFKATITVLAVKDGSATQMRVEVDPSSYDIVKDGDTPEKKTASPLAGKTVTVTRQADESVSNDFKGPDVPDDMDLVEQCLNPDQDYFPNHPVAVGDVWDASDLQAKHSGLGPNDALIAKCRLDSVKDVNGKKIGQITCNGAIVRRMEPGNEEDIEQTMTLQVDMAASQIIGADAKSTSKYVSQPNQPIQRKGGSEMTDKVTSSANPATQPAEPRTP